VVIGTTTASQVLVTDANNNVQSTASLAVNLGGSGNTTYTDGQLLIGNTTGNTLTKATLTQNSANQVIITNGHGTITLSTPQNIDTAAAVRFARLGLGINADSQVPLLIQGAAGPTVGMQINSSTGISMLSVEPNGTLNIGTTSSAALLFVQGTTTQPTLNLLTVASSTGANYLLVGSNSGIGIGTTTLASTTMTVAGQYYSSEVDDGTTTATTTIDWGKANVQRLGINTTTAAAIGINFANYKPGGRYLLLLQAATTTVDTINWQSIIHWSGGTAPTITTGTYGQVDILTFVCGFTNCYGGSNLNYSP